MKTLKLQFEEFLLNENRAYLGVRIGDILNAVQDLSENGKTMGTRQLVRNTEVIVNQIRKILHSNWGKEEEATLKSMQKIGVALAKAVEEKDDLETVIAAAQAELEALSGDIGSPVNQIGSPQEGEPEAEEETQTPPEGQEPKQVKPKPPQQGQDEQGAISQGSQPSGPQMPGVTMQSTPGGI
jgi:hypothetical protein